MANPGTTEPKNSLLVGLPPELQGLIFSDLNSYDLNRLCLTCKTIKAVVLPKLYNTVVIKVPQRWSRLPSLEGLLGSTGDGLKYTTELFIDVQQNPLRDSQQEHEDSRLPEEVRTEMKLQFYLPQNSMSNALNTLVRLLIVKIPQNQLQLFNWSHCCELDVSTLNLLIEKQKPSLGDFLCNRYSSSCDLSGSVVKDLYNFSALSIDPERHNCRWAALMIMANAKTLNHLSLGFNNRIAQDFALQRPRRYDEISTLFANVLKDTLSKYSQNPIINLSLGTLYLCGFDIGGVMRGEIAFHIDFNNITELRLESCPGLSQALFLLTGQGDASKLALRALEDLFVRIEGPDLNFSGNLERFLTSIRGLTHLKVLVDQTFNVQDLEPILKVHGKTLRTLVWDERAGSRIQLSTSTSLLSTRLSRLGNLRVIAQNCASLTSLGIAIGWEAVNGLDRCHDSVRRYFKKMPYLEVLNIRNLPELSGGAAMPMDYFVKGLASMFVDIVNKVQKSTLTTIALGASLYRDINIGTHHVVHTPVSDLLRLRIYKIDYDYRSPSGVTPVLSEIVKGAADTSEDIWYPPDLLYDYWLG